jgi:hypothetical protein
MAQGEGMAMGMTGKRRATGALAGALLGLALAASPAAAQPAARDADSWTVTLSPYLWFSGLGGTVAGPSRGETFSADFGDIFQAMKFAFMGMGEARRGNLSLVLDTMYLNLQQGVPAPGGGDFSAATARTQSAEFSLIALYTVLDRPAGRIELGGGLRAWWFQTDLRLDTGRLPGRTQTSVTSWADPVISARGVARLTDRLAFTAYADVGGFGAGSQLTWQAFATFDYRITDRLTASAGFRWIHIDYEKGRTNISLDMAGPIIGTTFRF